MKKLTKEIPERDAKRDPGAELLQAIHEIKAGKTGRVFYVAVSKATEARHKLSVSQAEFAAVIGVSVGTLQDGSRAAASPAARPMHCSRSQPHHPTWCARR